MKPIFYIPLLLALLGYILPLFFQDYMNEHGIRLRRGRMISLFAIDLVATIICLIMLIPQVGF